MNKFESKPLRSKLDSQDEGWVVQVYGRNRRLLCVLDPSHGWTFLIGCSFGLLLAVVWFNAARFSPPIQPAPPSETPKLQID